jgi:hypothetical protein
MTSIEHTGRQSGPVTLHIDTQAADIEVVADPRVTGSWIELSTPDSTGPAVDAIRNASFRDNGSDLHLNLREGQNGGGGMVIQSGGGVTMVNGRIISGNMGGFGGVSMGRITVRAILEPGSRLVAKTMSGDVVTKGVTSVDAQTMSGDIEADGVSASSRLKSMSGSIRVRGEGQPLVTASTMSGDVHGSGVDLDASSMSGRIRRG